MCNLVEFYELSSRNLYFIVLLSLVTNACSITAPFVDRRREAGAQTEAALYVGASKPNRPAICYNALTTPYSEVLALANQECIKQKTGSYAVPVKQTSFTCRLFIPNHFYFSCAGAVTKEETVDIPMMSEKK